MELNNLLQKTSISKLLTESILDTLPSVADLAKSNLTTHPNTPISLHMFKTPTHPTPPAQTKSK